jgi:hypothetical protein
MIYLHRSEWGHSAIFDIIIIIHNNFSSSLGSLFFKEVQLLVRYKSEVLGNQLLDCFLCETLMEILEVAESLSGKH